MPYIPALTSDVTDTATGTNTDITGLAFPVAAARMYYFEFNILWTIADITDGAQFILEVPDSPTFLLWKADHATSTSSDTILYSVTDGGEVSATSAAVTTGNATKIWGWCRPSVPGEIKVQIDSEGAGDVAAKVGCFGYYRDLNC